LLDTVPESVTASPRITRARFVASVTERVLWATVSLPVKLLPVATR
jgi:hypothetical protein